MSTPQSNGLFSVAGTKKKERGFCCMKLIILLCSDETLPSNWEHWHNAHLLASHGNCLYKNICSIYKRTIYQPINNRTS